MIYLYLILLIIGGIDLVFYINELMNKKTSIVIAILGIISSLLLIITSSIGLAVSNTEDNTTNNSSISEGE